MVAEINLGELNTLCEDRPHIVSEIETDDNEEAVGPTLREEMSEWASSFSVTHNALDALLKVQQRQGHKDLPSTARTLYDATRKFKVKTVGGVETIAYNVTDQLSLHLNKYPPESTQNLQSINISLNVDGLPLFQSSNKSLWPILCSINLTPKCIFPLPLSLSSLRQ